MTGSLSCHPARLTVREVLDVAQLAWEQRNGSDK